MFRIAICDDEPFICSQIEEFIEEISDILETKLSMEVFLSGIDLKNYLNKKSSYFDLIFLDIKMEKLDGIETGRYIREVIRDNLTNIVYISGNDNHLKELFDIDTMGFIEKPLQKSEIEKMISKAISKSANCKKQFKFIHNTITYRLNHSDILYFEKIKRIINVYYRNGSGEIETQSFYGKMQEIVNALNSNNFILIHNSYLVNYSYVHNCSYDHLILQSGMELRISQPKRKEVRQYMLRRLGDKQ